MAKTITQLPDATTVGASDEMIVQQSGITKRATVAELKTEVAALGANDITVSGANRSITNTTNHALSFGTNNTERMRIDSSGNVGIGTNVPAGIFAVSTSDPRKQFTIDVSADPVVKIGLPDWYNVGSLAFVNGSGGERMRIAASGNVGIGTTSSARPLEITNNGSCSLGLTDTSTGGATLSFSPPQNSSGFAQIDVSGANALRLNTNGAERMRIDGSGNVGIGTTSPAYTLHVNGSVAGTSAYNNLSDAREKENIVYGIANALDTVKALKPAKFDFKEGDKGKIGFIAQDVQPLVPEVITSYEKTLPDDTKEERLSIQESSLTAVLVAAIQELSAKVEALEAAANA